MHSSIDKTTFLLALQTSYLAEVIVTGRPLWRYEDSIVTEASVLINDAARAFDNIPIDKEIPEVVDAILRATRNCKRQDLEWFSFAKDEETGRHIWSQICYKIRDMLFMRKFNKNNPNYKI